MRKWAPKIVWIDLGALFVAQNKIASISFVVERFFIGKFHNPKKTLCWMFLCLATASTIRSDMFRVRKIAVVLS